MTTKKKVLVTGASGLIGGLVVKHLGHKYEMSGLNRRPVDGIPSTQASVADFDAMLPAFEGIDMVVHMSYPTGSKDNWERHMLEGIGGTRNVYEAARLNGVKRVVLGSTGETMMGYEREYPYGQLAGGAYDDVPDTWRMINYLDPVRPSSIYAACKVACEALGRYYADTYDMSVLVIRLGVTLGTDMPKVRRHYPGFQSNADCVQLVDKCLEAPLSLRYDIFDAISNNRWKWRDTTHPQEVLGWKPTGSSDNYDIEDKGDWAQVIGGKAPPKPE